MGKISILDCTLRDGGHVNKGKFGYERIRNIIHSLNDSGIDIIEIGFLRDIEYNKQCSDFSNISDVQNLKLENITSKLCLLARAGTYDFNKIESANEVINFIRIAFRKDEIKDAIIAANILKEKGFKYFLNPIDVTSYSNNELIEVISILNTIDPVGVAIVDTYGALTMKRFNDILEIFETSLNKNISLGIHLHENLSISNGLIQDYLINYKGNRNTIIDASLFGMGRIPGNLPIELLITTLSKYSIGNYNLLPILSVIENEILPEKKLKDWGYSQPYLISAFFNIDRTFAENCMNYNYEQTYKILEAVKNSGEGSKYDKILLDRIIKETFTRHEI